MKKVYCCYKIYFFVLILLAAAAGAALPVYLVREKSFENFSPSKYILCVRGGCVLCCF